MDDDDDLAWQRYLHTTSPMETLKVKSASSYKP
jgi:hypothetical protein